MRECWINVYINKDGDKWIGNAHNTSRMMANYVANQMNFNGDKIVYRIHVKMKPGK